jgi:pilus assembly protein CpaE
MHPDLLHIAVLYGTEAPHPPLSKVLEGLPRVQVQTQAGNPEEFLNQPPSTPVDSFLVYLDGDHVPPEWLEQLTLTFPKTVVLVCSPRREPDFLIRAMQLGVREFLPLPLAREDLEAALERVRTAKRRLSAATATSRGKVVAVTGHKGGVGTTTIAVNLAMTLASLQPDPLALVDLGRPFPDIGNLLDLEGPYSLADMVQNLNDLDQAFIQKILHPYDKNLAILHGLAVTEQDSLDLETLEKIFAMLRPLYRWIIVDLSHWLDELFLKVLHEADLVLLLTELTVPDLRNLSALWPLLREWQVVQKDKMRVVVNRYVKGNGLALRDLEQVVHTSVFFTLPSDYPALLEAANQGVPLTKAAPRSKLCRSLQELAQELVKLDQGAAGVDAGPQSRPLRSLLSSLIKR